MSLTEELITLRFKIANNLFEDSSGLGKKKMILIYAINFMIEVLSGTKLTSDFALDALNTIYQENIKWMKSFLTYF